MLTTETKLQKKARLLSKISNCRYPRPFPLDITFQLWSLFYNLYIDLLCYCFLMRNGATQLECWACDLQVLGASPVKVATGSAFVHSFLYSMCSALYIETTLQCCRGPSAGINSAKVKPETKTSESGYQFDFTRHVCMS